MMLNDSNNMPYAILINIISMLKCFKFNSNCVLFDFNKGKKRYKQNDEVHRVFKIIHIKIWFLRHKFCLRKCWAITYSFEWGFFAFCDLMSNIFKFFSICDKHIKLILSLKRYWVNWKGAIYIISRHKMSDFLVKQKFNRIKEREAVWKIHAAPP